MANTPVPACAAASQVLPGCKRSLADNIVLISSVSGGSLATAYYLANGGNLTNERSELKYSTKSELLHLMKAAADEQLNANGLSVNALGSLQESRRELASNVKQRLTKGPERTGDGARIPGEPPVPDKVLQEKWRALNRVDLSIARIQAVASCANLVKENDDKNRPPDGLNGEDAWILRQQFFDDMCQDFMAPILRGILPPVSNRGDTLLTFWAERFGWNQFPNGPYTDHTGFEDSAQDAVGCHVAKHPLVIFNASDVSTGTRLTLGFPPLPAELFCRENRKSTKSVRTGGRLPSTLPDLFPMYHCEVTLAQAVRLSSNFPWGFPVYVIGAEPDNPVRVLDGGVVDNTGMDSIYELFQTFARIEAAKDHPLAARVKRILGLLRNRGVMLFEVDSGAKGSPAPGGWPWRPTTEPLQAIDNANIKNTEQWKTHCVKSTLAVLQARLDDAPDGISDTTRVSLARLQGALTKTAIHIPFRCNGRGHAQAEEVMTAWTLGPNDKAHVLVSFLLALRMWRAQLADVQEKCRTSMASAVERKQDAEKILRAAEVKQLIEDTQKAITEAANNVNAASDKWLKAEKQTSAMLAKSAKSAKSAISAKSVDDYQTALRKLADGKKTLTELEKRAKALKLLDPETPSKLPQTKVSSQLWQELQESRAAQTRDSIETPSRLRGKSAE